MKKDIHPKYYSNAKIICACGNVIETGSTVKEIKVEICSACHPLYTGKNKILDTTGRVERFKKITKKAAGKKVVGNKKAKRKARQKKSKAETKKVISKKRIHKKK